MGYTTNQKKAIGTLDRNLQIIACAGSGKTQVISARIVEILKTNKKSGIKPGNIVAFTFTEKAAGELKDRIHQICKEELGTDEGLAEMFVGTIHGYCLNLLQAPPLYRYLKYTVLTEVRQRLLIDRYSSKSGLTDVPLLAGGTLRRWLDSKLYQQLLSILQEGSVNLRLIPKGVKDAARKYDELLGEKKLLDYTKIVSEAVSELEKNAALRKKVGTEVKFLVVDEYQDVNPLQEQLIRLIHDLGANVCVVGDDDQTVYQWRGSDVDNIIKFAGRYPRVETIPLNENFRSNEGVVLSARHIAESNGTNRLPKKMESTAAQPYKRGDVLALEFTDPQKEADWIAKKIKALHGTTYKDKPTSTPRGLTYADFAVLLRSVKNDAEPILAALDANEVPYVVVGMNVLFDDAAVRAARDVFFFLADYAHPERGLIDEKELRRSLRNSGLGFDNKRIDAGIAFLRDRKARIGDEMDAELYLQRVFLDFLQATALREEEVSKAAGEPEAGEIAYYNLGKFSQVISDFEHVHFNSEPGKIYPSFAEFLHYQAPDYYPEGNEDKGFAKPSAVQVLTVHKAKGMQWPTVFVPCLRKNRFPEKRHGGRTVWHVIPDRAVRNADRYKGTVEDERRLFYVALTRAERYLFCSWAPVADNQQQRKVSPFFQEFTTHEKVLTRDGAGALPPKIAPRARKEDLTLALTFSELKYYFDCPYLFKLRFLYGFDTPISRALGYGKSVHDALAEIHAESIKGRIPEVKDVDRLVADHLHLPFASKPIRNNLEKSAKKALTKYLKEYGGNLDKLVHVEQIVELKLADGIVVSGRIDLIRKTDTHEIVVVDFKSDERAQAEEITRRQLHIYAVGYEQLSGKRPDLIEVHNLDKGGSTREVIDDKLVASTTATVVSAGRDLRNNSLPRLARWGDRCATCEMSGVCRNPDKTGGKAPKAAVGSPP